MSTPILATKLYIPPPRPKVVLRSHLIERLNEGHPSGRTPGVTLISAPAGFGKTTLLSEWVNDLRLRIDDLRLDAGSESQIVNHKLVLSEVEASKIVNRVAWLSLDEGDNDPARFLTYLVAALQTIAAGIGTGMSEALQSPQPPPVETILTALLNEITALSNNFVLILDDYHAIDAKPVDQALTFLLEHLPPQMHLVIATREDPHLPLARLRAQGQLTELRAADLRFSPAEAAEFLNQVMGLTLSAEDIAALEARTEGWIAGLQMAALALQGMISMQGHQDAASFIKSFTGSHHFIMDYLVEEVLQQQSERVQTFLLRTSILDRLYGPLCDAILLDPSGSASGLETLEYLERANLFIVPLDNARRWYRYHHLFADLLRQRLHQSFASTTGDAESHLNELHIRASQWYEDNGFQLEAFQHAAIANDVERAERLIDGKGIPLHFSGAVTPILDWLESLPRMVLDARPSLWWRHAAMLLINGQTIGVDEKLQAAEAALAAILQGAEPDDKTRNLIGQIAAARATLALTRYDVETMLVQSRRALEYLYPDTLFTRATAYWTQGYAHILQGERAAARQAYMEAISLSQASGAIFTLILATIGLGNVQEVDNQLHQAAETYRRVLQLTGNQPQQIIHEVHLGLGRIFYEWNDLDAAEQHGQQSLQLARQYERIIDRFIICEVFLARLKLARGEVAEAAAMLAQVDQSARQHNYVHRMPEIAAAQVLTLLRQGDLAEAAHLAQAHKLPLSQARVHLARGDTSAALSVLETRRQQAEARGWEDERLKVMILQAVALHAHGEKDKAMQTLVDALARAEPEGFIRIFVDEGEPMAELLKRMKSEGGRLTVYIDKLLSAFEKQTTAHPSSFMRSVHPLIEPLSQRELEVLQLIAQGLSNDEIGKRLFLALDTVKGHNRRIYDKLQVQRRTEAVARARELGLL
jgi:LuxR family maltose regulon positive regulatory protein